MNRRGSDLIIGGELVLSGYVLSDEQAGWTWEEEVYFCPQLVREALQILGDGRVTVRLSSGGGDPVAGEVIRATLANHPGGCRIIVEGEACSAASLILMGGAVREMTAGSFIMLHDPSGYVYGNAAELRTQADVLDMLSRVYAQVYATRSGHSLDEMLAIMAAETFYAPAEAIAAGLADGIAAEVQLAATPVPLSPEERRPHVEAAMTSWQTLMRQKSAGRANAGATRPAAAGGNPAAVATTMELTMNRQNTEQPPAPAPAPVQTQVAPPAAPPAANDAAVLAAVMAERQRVTMIREMARPFMAAGRLTEEDVTALVNDGTPADAAGSRFMTTMASREPAPGSQRPAGRGMDETETRRLGMEEALVARLARRDPHEAARPFMDFSLVEMAATRLGQTRVPANFGQREEVLRMAFHSTSDFPILLENAMNRSLAARYAQANPVYRRLARQRTYVDFRDHTTVRMGDFPNLQPVSPEAGEIKAGTFGESKEKTAVKAYGVQVLLSRALLVNDSLDGLAQVLADRGRAVARFEETTFFAMALSGANADGPTLVTTGRQVFNTTDGSKAGTAAAINLTSVSAGRAALRKRKSLDGNDLDLDAAILLVGPDKETEALAFNSPIIPTQISNANPLARLMEVIATPKITGNAWYMFAAVEDAPCFEWGLLEGYTAPRFRMEDPFGVQGTKMSLEHDFGCGAIDFNGGYKNAGA